jgi:hypothetical protein
MHLMSVLEYLQSATPENVKRVNQFRNARLFVLDRCDAKLFITERKNVAHIGVYVVQLGLDKYDYVASKHKAPQLLGDIVSVDTNQDTQNLAYRLFAAQVTAWLSAAEHLYRLEGEGENHGKTSKMQLA